ncbi:CgeB family protein [Myroides odoratimimus]|uniref:hypothetical protein n=1 Tax=Myroides odoratimimus TaxID=76832 RepID=UPI0029C01E8F|nr:hypothetical protein [Myroides odoratimimus]MDX4975368.1 hypothetical protein [Myroides odoratimimus]
MIGNQLVGKKILFFCVQTFGLEKQVKSKLEELGAFVTYYDERPKNNTFTKAIIRLKKELYTRKIVKYYNSIIKNTENDSFDYMLVIRGEVVPEFFLKLFKENHPSCKLIFYNWDSFKNTPNTKKLLDLYDTKFSFDPYDAKDSSIFFRPLYYIDSYASLESRKDFLYDLLFLGTAHSDRYIISNRIKENLEEKGKKVYCFYYMQGKLVYFYKKLFDSTFQHFDYKKLSFESLSTSKMLMLYNQSKVILDINHPGQKGLTMRTFEAIGAKKKLITTNEEIKKLPFYNRDNILVLDRNKPEIDLSFVESDYCDIDSEIYQKLSIEGWLFNLFINDESEYWSKFI